jgi:hypothetical protein
VTIRLKCFLDPSCSDGRTRIVGIEGLLGDKDPPPRAVRYLARPNNDIPIRDKSTWHEGAADDEWQEAEVLWCAAPSSMLIGWRVPTDRFVLYRSYRFALRDPGDAQSVLSVDLPLLSWPYDNTADPWPCSLPPAKTLGKGSRALNFQATLLVASLIALPIGWTLANWPSQLPSGDGSVIETRTTRADVERPLPGPATLPPLGSDRRSGAIDPPSVVPDRTNAPKEAPVQAGPTHATADREGTRTETPEESPIRSEVFHQLTPPLPDPVQGSAVAIASTQIRSATDQAPPSIQDALDAAAGARSAVFKGIASSLRAQHADEARSLCLSAGEKDPQIARYCGIAFDPLRTHRAPTSDKSFALRCYDLAVALGDPEAERRAKALRGEPD